MRQIIFTGNVGNDAEIRENNNTKEKFITISVCEQNSYIDKITKEKINRNEWFSCSLNYEKFKNIAEYLKKGTRVTVIGHPTIHSYKNVETKKLTSIFRVSVFQIDFFNAKEKVVKVDNNGEIIK